MTNKSEHVVWHNATVTRERREQLNGQNARAGLIPNYTGISSPFEEPEKPEITVATDSESLDQSIANVLSFLSNRKLLP